MNKRLTILFFSHLFLFYLSQTKPPESYSLIRGVNENINLNSGNLDLTIPLVSLPIGDLKLNNSLNYESRGFVPHISPSYVGLNWNMMQFGKITRESRRIDLTGANIYLLQSITNTGINFNDLNNYYRNDCIKTAFKSDGGEYPSKKNIYENPYGNDYYASFYKPNLVTPSAGEYIGKSYTFEPDKFYFDFMGYKGYFIIDNEGKPIVYCENASLKIDIEGYGLHDIFGNITFSQFKIKDDRGNEYIFGGNTDALDINYSYSRVYYEDYAGQLNGEPYFSQEAKTNYIDSWSLKKIILNNGDVVEAYYQNPNLTLLNNSRGGFNIAFSVGHEDVPKEDINFPAKQLLIDNNLSISHVRTFNETLSPNFCSPSCQIGTYMQTDTYTKKAVLDSIKINDIAILYKYTLSENPIELTTKYLNEISLKKGNKIIKKINLLYENFGSTNKRTFLQSVVSSNNENLNFNYYNTDDFPPLKNSDYATNKLGFWTGQMNSTRFNQGEANQDFGAFDTGLLKTVFYPTKGSTTYFYELGDYSKIYTYGEHYDPYSQPPKLYDENKTVNAPRIYKKIETDLIKNEETLYKYKNDLGASSGIIDDAVLDIAGFHSNKNLNANLNSYNSLHYSKVDVIIQGKGLTKYQFSDRVTNPDISTSKNFHTPNNSICTAGQVQWREDQRIYLSKQNERGKVLKEEIYDNNNLKLKETVYSYNNFLNKFPNLTIPSNCADCKVSDLNYYVRTIGYYAFNNAPCNIQTLYVPVLPYLQKSQTTREYLNNKVIESTKSISYNEGAKNWHPYPIEESLTTPAGTVAKRYLFAPDLLKKDCRGFMGCSNENSGVGAQWDIYDGMIASNYLVPLIEMIKNTDNKFSLKENLFTKGTTFLYAPKKIRHSLANAVPDFDNYNISLVNNIVDDIDFNVYDNKANSLQSTMKDGIPVTTIYGYDQTLPIATITGISYEQLMQIFGLPATPTGYLSLDIVSKSNTDKDEAGEQLLLTALNNFRKNASLSGYQITTYTYDPLIGVRSITPPSGIRENYLYDSAGRLQKVVDINGQTVKEMKYNYKN